MTTQTQGKGKKKNKEVSKVSLDEFNSINAPHGHSVVSVKMTGLDWAATMADYEQSADTQQIIVPVAPRAQRGPNVDFDAISDTPPFRASLYNLPMQADEKEISDRFLTGCNVVRVDTSQKTSTTVEFETKQDLYDALCKDGNSFKGRTVNICLFGQTPRNEYSDRYGRGGNSSYGDRYGDRGQSGGFGGFGGSRMGDRYGEHSGGGGFGRDREFGGGYNRAGGGGGGGSGFGNSRGGYGDGYQERGNFRDIRGSYTSGGGEPAAEEPENWRDRPTVKPPPFSNNGSRQPYTHPRPDPPHYQPPSQQYHHHESYHQPRYNQHQNQPPSHHSPPSYRNDRIGSRDRPYNSAAPLPPPTVEERPRLVIHKRTTPLNVDDVSSVSRNEAIFGQAKPSSKPYQKMKEVEEKLSSVQISDKKSPSQSGSQPGSQPGSAPRSRQVSERSRE